MITQKEQVASQQLSNDNNEVNMRGRGLHHQHPVFRLLGNHKRVLIALLTGCRAPATHAEAGPESHHLPDEACQQAYHQSEGISGHVSRVWRGGGTFLDPCLGIFK